MRRSRAYLFPAAPFSRLPYWLLAILLGGALVAWSLVRAEDCRRWIRHCS